MTSTLDFSLEQFYLVTLLVFVEFVCVLSVTVVQSEVKHTCEVQVKYK